MSEKLNLRTRENLEKVYAYARPEGDLDELAEWYETEKIIVTSVDVVHLTEELAYIQIKRCATVEEAEEYIYNLGKNKSDDEDFKVVKKIELEN